MTRSERGGHLQPLGTSTERVRAEEERCASAPETVPGNSHLTGEAPPSSPEVWRFCAAGEEAAAAAADAAECLPIPGCKTVCWLASDPRPGARKVGERPARPAASVVLVSLRPAPPESRTPLPFPVPPSGSRRLARLSSSSGPGSGRPREGVGGSGTRSPEAGNQPARLGCPAAASPAAAPWAVGGIEGPWPGSRRGCWSPVAACSHCGGRGGVGPQVAGPRSRLLPRSRCSSPGGAAVLRLAPLPAAHPQTRREPRGLCGLRLGCGDPGFTILSPRGERWPGSKVREGFWSDPRIWAQAGLLWSRNWVC